MKMKKMHLVPISEIRNSKESKAESGMTASFHPKYGTLMFSKEHKTLIVPPGIYKKFQEEEVDHFAGSVMRKVID